jgi:hypothetical protein
MAQNASVWLLQAISAQLSAGGAKWAELRASRRMPKSLSSDRDGRFLDRHRHSPAPKILYPPFVSLSPKNEQIWNRNMPLAQQSNRSQTLYSSASDDFRPLLEKSGDSQVSDSESLVLPLHYEAKWDAETSAAPCVVNQFFQAAAFASCGLRATCRVAARCARRRAG